MLLESLQGKNNKNESNDNILRYNIVLTNLKFQFIFKINFQI